MTTGLVLLSACSLFPQAETPQVPQGEMEVTGTLEPLELTLYQFGTHQLRTESGDIIALQSRTHDLSEYLNQEVTVKGMVDVSALDETKWALTVDTVKTKEFTGELADFESKKLGLRFSYPAIWALEEGSDGVTLKNESGTVLTIETFSEKSVSGFAASNESGEGTPITVAAQPALRFADSSQTRIYLAGTSGTTVYRITYYESVDDSAQKTAFYDLLQSLQLVYYRQVTGAPCGGATSLKCPADFRCELSSNEPEAEGICVSLTEAQEDLACPLMTPPLNCTNYKPRSFNAAGCPTGYECLDEKADTLTSTDDSAEVDLAEVDQQTPVEKTPSLSQTTYEDMRTYENGHRGYSIQYHRNWYYASFGAVNGAIWAVGFSDEALETPETALILVEEYKGERSKKSTETEGDVYSVELPGSEGTYFVIKGTLEQKDLINRMAETLSFTL